MNDKFERWKESEAPGIKAAVMEQLQGEREFTSLLMRRNVEDAVIATMKSALGDPDVSGRANIVREFRRCYTFYDWTDEDFQLLLDSPARQVANAAHIDKDSARFKRFYDALISYLSHYDPETVPLYRKYIEVRDTTTLVVPR